MEAGARVRELVGREVELVRLAGFLDAVARGPAAFVVEGEPGVGKTELWRAAVAESRERGYRVLEARPAQAEDGLAFAGLADLLAGAHDEIAALAAPQRRPLSVALLLEEAEGAPLDPRAIAVGVLDVFRTLAVVAPLVVAIDDVQWLDRASAAALSFAIRRADGERLGALLAQRSETVAPLVLDGAAEPERIELGPLSFGAVQHLLGERLDAAFSRSTSRRIHERSGGNPFFALELGRALEARGGTVSPGEELPVPGNLERLVHDRIAALPAETADSLAAVAALAEPTLELVAEEGNLDPAFEAGVVVLDRDRVRFAHPLLAAAAYDLLPPRRRMLLHRRLADVVKEPEQRARHLALGADGPDSQLAAVVEEAAAQAHLRGAPETAADLAERALRLDDGADVDSLARRTAAAAHYHGLIGDDRRARELLENALPRAPTGTARARLLYELARSTVDLDAELAILDEALGEAGDDPRLEAEIRSRLAWEINAVRSVAEGERYADEAVAAAERLGDPAVLARALGMFAGSRFFLGRGLHVEMMERALALEPECDSLRVDERPVTCFGVLCKWAGDVDRSRVLLEEARRIGERRGDSTVTAPLFYSCWLELLSDRWQRGLELADELYTAGAELERADDMLCSLCIRSILLALLGDEEGARRSRDEAHGLDEEIGMGRAPLVDSFGLSLLELSLDRPAAALGLARSLARPLGWEDPGLLFSFPVHAEAAIAIGELAEAEELLDWVEERAVRLDREWALACAARCRGLLAAARGDEPGAIAAFERALAEHARVQYRRFDLARTLLAQGETLRRFKRKRAARESIEAAIAIFDELGAALWSAKARRELARISGRRTAEGLTETERRVAELVAAGHSNKQVANELHVTVRTVESNLTKVYAKLGVHSRTELASRFAT